MQTEREMSNRYDFKGTPASIAWLDDKRGIKITGENEWQCEAILDIIRKKLATRSISSHVLDLSRELVQSNLKAHKDVVFKQGLSQDDAKIITKLLRDHVPKVKAQIQGDAVRVTSASKDELQKAMTVVRDAELTLPLQFINYR